jgi:hypothetical protein
MKYVRPDGRLAGSEAANKSYQFSFSRLHRKTHIILNIREPWIERNLCEDSEVVNCRHKFIQQLLKVIRVEPISITQHHQAKEGGSARASAALN